MTGNSSIFSTFQSHPSTSTVTLADGSQSCVLGSGIIFSTPSLPLSSVLSLSNFSFNLISVSKLTRALKCYISFFPGFCLFQDLMTKQIIGRGRESVGLYILDNAKECLRTVSVIHASKWRPSSDLMCRYSFSEWSG